MKRRAPLISIAWLGAVWMLLWRDFSWFTVITGVLAAIVVLVVFPLPHLDKRPVVSPWACVVLLTRFSWDLITASIHVAWLAVRPGPVVSGRVLRIPLRCRDDLVQTITAEMVSLVPGTVVIDLDGPTGVLTVHALDTHTPEAIERVRREVWQQEARVVRALGSAADITRVLEEES